MESFNPSRKEFLLAISPAHVYLFAVTDLVVIVAATLGKPLYLFGVAALLIFAFKVFNKTVWGLYLLPIALSTPIIIVPGTRLHIAGAVVFITLASFLGRCALSGEIKGISFPKPYKLMLMLFFFAAFLSLLNAPHPTTGLILTVKLALAFIVVFGLIYDFVDDRGTLKKMTLMIVVAGLIAAFYGIFQYYFSAGTLSFGQGPRIFGEAGGGYGAFIGIAIVISISRLLTSKGISRIVLFLSFLPPLILALLLSRTRAWILGTVLSTALVLFLWAYKKLGLKRSITIFLILILLCPIFLGSLKAAFLDTFSYLFLRQKGMSSEVRVIKDIGEVYDLSLLQRYQIWDFALHIFARYPLTGIGVGNFRITSALRPELSEGVSGGGWSDNHYVNVLAETGIPGAIAWTYLVYLLLSCCFRILRSSGEEYRSATLGLTGSLLVFAVGGMFWNLTSGIIDSAIFALVISLTFSTKKIIDRNETQILNRVNLTKRDSH